MPRVEDLEYAHHVRVDVGPARFDGILMDTAFDPARTFAGFVSYALDGDRHFGLIRPRATALLHGTRWASALLYDVTGETPAVVPAPSKAPGRAFLQRAELDLIETDEHS